MFNFTICTELSPENSMTFISFPVIVRKYHDKINSMKSSFRQTVQEHCPSCQDGRSLKPLIHVSSTAKKQRVMDVCAQLVFAVYTTCTTQHWWEHDRTQLLDLTSSSFPSLLQCQSAEFLCMLRQKLFHLKFWKEVPSRMFCLLDYSYLTTIC